MNGRWLAADVEGFDGSADEGDCAHSHHTAEQKTESAACESEEERFAEKAEGDGGAGGADGTQHTDFMTAADDGDGDGVVDEKCADN